MGKGNVQNEFVLYLLSEECLSPSWPYQHKNTASLHGLWELLVSEKYVFCLRSNGFQVVW